MSDVYERPPGTGRYPSMAMRLPAPLHRHLRLPAGQQMLTRPVASPQCRPRPSHCTHREASAVQAGEHRPTRDEQLPAYQHPYQVQ